MLNPKERKVSSRNGSKLFMRNTYVIHNAIKRASSLQFGTVNKHTST